MDLIATAANGPMLVHEPTVCGGEDCCIHNPSDHALRNAPLRWRGRVMERICPCGNPHPDPDDVAWRLRAGRAAFVAHDCCGCCTAAPVPGRFLQTLVWYESELGWVPDCLPCQVWVFDPLFIEAVSSVALSRREDSADVLMRTVGRFHSGGHVEGAR